MAKKEKPEAPPDETAQIQQQAAIVAEVLGGAILAGVNRYLDGQAAAFAANADRELWDRTYLQTYNLQATRYYAGTDADRQDIDRNGGPAQLAQLTADGAVRRSRESVARQYQIAGAPTAG